MAGPNFGKYKKMAILFTVDNPHVVYLAGGLSLWAFRKYQVANTYNYWFGKCEFERRVAANRI